MSVVIPFSEASQIRLKLGLPESRRLVFTNGCFDVLHAGHVRYLEGARKLGDALVVGLNGDDSVRQLKGENRPINGEDDRAEVLTGLRSVDAVVIFPEVRATALIEKLRPDVYVKGGDYTVESLNPEERAVLESIGCEIGFVPLVPGRSTTSTLAKMRGSAE
ncbi:MAG: adenylyltransferase/cytidyltransferase family protein [Chthoniobacterales bacterium]